MDRIVPFAVKGVWLEVHECELLVGDPTTLRIRAVIEAAANGEALRRGRGRDPAITESRRRRDGPGGRDAALELGLALGGPQQLLVQRRNVEALADRVGFQEALDLSGGPDSSWSEIW